MNRWQWEERTLETEKVRVESPPQDEELMRSCGIQVPWSFALPREDA
jgi:hypothetical protein